MSGLCPFVGQTQYVSAAQRGAYDAQNQINRRSVAISSACAAATPARPARPDRPSPRGHARGNSPSTVHRPQRGAHLAMQQATLPAGMRPPTNGMA